jgi:hypothetical protein
MTRQITRTYLLVEVERSKDIDHLEDKAAGRVRTMEGVENATAIRLSTHEAFQLAKAQLEQSYG